MLGRWILEKTSLSPSPPIPPSIPPSIENVYRFTIKFSRVSITPETLLDISSMTLEDKPVGDTEIVMDIIAVNPSYKGDISILHDYICLQKWPSNTKNWDNYTLSKDRIHYVNDDGKSFHMKSYEMIMYYDLVM